MLQKADRDHICLRLSLHLCHKQIIEASINVDTSVEFHGYNIPSHIGSKKMKTVI